MATAGTGQGPGNKPGYSQSWAQLVGSTLPSSWNKNILEIILEKDTKGPYNVSDVDCCHLLLKLGIDPRSSLQVESVQICPSGRGLILITFKQGLDIDRFSRYDVLEVTKTGIRAVQVRPAGKKDSVITIKGLHPNTRDDGVIDYLGKFGKVITNKVVYGTYGGGPLQGIRNGDRSYKVEISPGSNIGTYHAIDGQRVTIRYSGQLQTCARCHETAVLCKGGAIARRCEAAQGEKVEFSDYIQKLWKKIGYAPGEVEMAAIYDEHNDLHDESERAVQQEGGVFTPPKQVSDPEKFSGVTVKKFPKDTDNGDIMELLVNAGLPDHIKDSVIIKSNGSVDVRNLENRICIQMIDYLHNQVYLGRKLFCNGFIALTPEKEVELGDKSQAEETAQSSTAATTSVPASPALGSPSSVPRVSLPLVSAPPDTTVSALVRRYSLSMPMEPPVGSIAADILNTKKNLLSEIKDLKDQLSEFDSCVSEQSSSEESERYEVGGKKGPKQKRKAGKTPLKSNEKQKKANLDWYEHANDGLTN